MSYTKPSPCGAILSHRLLNSYAKAQLAVFTEIPLFSAKLCITGRMIVDHRYIWRGQNRRVTQDDHR